MISFEILSDVLFRDKAAEFLDAFAREHAENGCPVKRAQISGLRQLAYKADQIRTVRPAPPGACFTFTVDFYNLREEELNLLLYCLVLEENVVV